MKFSFSFQSFQNFFFLLALLALWELPSAAPAASCFVECESFQELGGWVVDPHSMAQIGSSYVMAHGYGQPVPDAVTQVSIPEAGTYVVWARTRDWTAVWNRGTPAGQFQLGINGQLLPETLGTRGIPWAWQKAGTVELPAGDAELRLHDLTGFNGRCDALYLSTDPNDAPPEEAAALEAFRHAKCGTKIQNFSESFDLIVVGGGMSGICSAMAASRLGLKVLLLQDREVLGGCNSSEVRVGLGGHIHVAPYPQLGNVVYEIQPLHGSGGTYPAEFYEDARKEIVFKTPNCRCRLLLREHVYALEMDPEHPKRIRSVLSRNTHSGTETRFTAPLFVDATGDAVLARMAGCEVLYGREARSAFNEINAPVEADRQVMGHSVLWYARNAGKPISFPDIDWAIPFDESKVYYIRGGDWEQEAGQYHDMADETELIRDYGLLSIYSNWSFIKNHSARKKEFECDALNWVSPIGGKRESYRTVGDHVLTQNDLEDHVSYPDQTAAITWDIDLHFPDPDNVEKFGEPFRSCAYHRGFGEPYAVPYRCLYARDCENLFLAGRHISTTHVAFAAVRVMRTLGMLGEVVGMAASICREHDDLPRDVYEKHLDELKAKMEAGVPLLPTYHAYGSGMQETYHFKELGFIRISPNPSPNLSDRVKKAIKALGMVHRNEHPELREKKNLPVMVIESEAHFRPEASAENDLVLNGAELIFEGGNVALLQEVAVTEGSSNTIRTEDGVSARIHWAIRGAGKTLAKTGPGTLELVGGVQSLPAEIDLQQGTLILGGEKAESCETPTGKIFLRPGTTLKCASRNVFGIWTPDCQTLPPLLGIDSATLCVPDRFHVNLGPIEIFDGTITSPNAPGATGSESLGNVCFAGKVTARGKSQITARRVSFRADFAAVNGESGVFDLPEASDALTVCSALVPFHGGRLTKSGNGSLTLSGSWEASASVTVGAGTLILESAAQIQDLHLGPNAILMVKAGSCRVSGSITSEAGAKIVLLGDGKLECGETLPETLTVERK